MLYANTPLRIPSASMPWLLAVLLLLIAALPSSGTTLRRASLERLVDDHELIVVAQATGMVSYWNEDRSMILTDVTVRPDTVLKGQTHGEAITLTLPGGTVNDVTVAIVSGAQLEPGGSYLLFLGQASLVPGHRAWTVRQLSQGVFDIELDEGGELRVLSQARRVPLLQDSRGQVEPPGGQKGLRQGDIFDTITALVRQGETP